MYRSFVRIGFECIRTACTTFSLTTKRNRFEASPLRKACQACQRIPTASMAGRTTLEPSFSKSIAPPNSLLKPEIEVRLQLSHNFVAGARFFAKNMEQLRVRYQAVIDAIHFAEIIWIVQLEIRMITINRICTDELAPLGGEIPNTPQRASIITRRGRNPT